MLVNANELQILVGNYLPYGMQDSFPNEVIPDIRIESRN
jgi:hypothetical protein